MVLNCPAWTVLLPHEGTLGIKVKLFPDCALSALGSLSGPSPLRDI